jgi:hypothetical protein
MSRNEHVLRKDVLRKEVLRKEVIQDQLRSLTRRLAELEKTIDTFELQSNSKFNLSLQEKMNECYREMENTKRLIKNHEL